MKRKVAFGILVCVMLLGISGIIPSWIQRQKTLRLNELPSEAYQAITSGNVTLYSLDPIITDSRGGAGVFHYYRVLGQVAVPDAASRQRLADAVRHNIASWRFTHASCFNPRHGLRAVLGTETFDFVICFECHQLHYIPPSGSATYHDFGEELRVGPFVDLLAAANVPTAKGPVGN